MTTLLTLTLFAMCVIQPAPSGSTLGWSPPTLAEYDDLTPLDGIIIKAEPEVWVLAPEERIAALEDQIAELRKKVEALEGLGDHIVDLTAMVEALGDSGAICEVYGHRWRNLEDVRSRHCDICGKHETLEWK